MILIKVLWPLYRSTVIVYYIVYIFSIYMSLSFKMLFFFSSIYIYVYISQEVLLDESRTLPSPVSDRLCPGTGLVCAQGSSWRPSVCVLFGEALKVVATKSWSERFGRMLQVNYLAVLSHCRGHTVLTWHSLPNRDGDGRKRKKVRQARV